MLLKLQKKQQGLKNVRFRNQTGKNYSKRKMSIIQNPDHSIQVLSQQEVRNRRPSFFKNPIDYFTKQDDIVTFKNSPRTRRFLSDFYQKELGYLQEEMREEDHYSREGYGTEGSDNFKKTNDSTEDSSVDGKSEEFDESVGDGDSSSDDGSGGKDPDGDNAGDNVDGDSLEEDLQ